MSIEQSVRKVEAWLDRSLPAEYRAFLENYVEQVSEDGTLLYGADIVIERNETFETKKYAAGYLAVGDDSGGRCFLISLDAASHAVYTSDQGDMDPDGFDLLTEDFPTWLAGARSRA